MEEDLSPTQWVARTPTHLDEPKSLALKKFDHVAGGRLLELAAYAEGDAAAAAGTANTEAAAAAVAAAAAAAWAEDHAGWLSFCGTLRKRCHGARPYRCGESVRAVARGLQPRPGDGL